MCPDRETLSAYYDNEVEGNFRIMIENHIENCTECSNKLEKIKTASSFINSGFDDIEILKNKVWISIENKLDRKNVPDLWHRKINIPLPLLAAASFLIITITALLSTLLYITANNDYRYFSVSEAVNLNGENQNYFLDKDQTVNVELQLPEDAFFIISGTPQLIREVDYIQDHE